MRQVHFRSGDDWVAMYVDGKRVEEGHSLHRTHVLDALGIPYTEDDVSYEDWKGKYEEDPGLAYPDTIPVEECDPSPADVKRGQMASQLYDYLRHASPDGIRVAALGLASLIPDEALPDPEEFVQWVSEELLAADTPENREDMRTMVGEYGG